MRLSLHPREIMLPIRTSRIRFYVLAIAVSVSLVGSTIQAADAPTSLPAENRVGHVFQRLREHLTQLNLDDKQKTKIRELFEQTKTQMDELRAGVQAGDREARGKAGDILRDVRTQLTELLTPEQQKKLREMMLDRAPTRTSGATTQPGDAMMSVGSDEMMSEPQSSGLSPGLSEKSPDSTPTDEALTSGLPARGSPAPDFELTRLGGQTAKLSSFKGKVVLIVFGSYTCPSFRQRAAGIEELRKDLGVRATVLVVYTREAHPSDGWDVERNRDDGVTIQQPRDADERKAVAERAKQAMKLTTPILLDRMDDQTAKNYGAFPNGAVVVGRDGNIAYRQKWFDPVTIKRHIDAAIANKTPASQPSEL